MVSDVTITNALSNTQATNNSSAQLAEDFNDFLTLLTVQLQNQDPLDPVDTTEFTNQLVAFTGVEQQINTNQKLDDLVALNIGTAFSQAQNYVGQEISYLSSEFEFTGAPSKISYSLGGEAQIAKVNIFSESGEVVYSENVSGSVGVQEFTWNGQLDTGGFAVPGTYEVRIDALDGNDDPVDSTTVVSGRVRGTESQNGQIFLLVGNRAVPLANVLNTNTSTVNEVGDALTAALGYVGLDITYLNSGFNYDGSTPEDVIYTLEQNAAQASISIYSDSGERIYVGDVDTEKGQNLFRWSGETSAGGQAPAGEYVFIIEALDNDTNPIGVSSMASGIASGVETQNGLIYLNIGGTSVELGDVVSADVPAVEEEI